MCIKVSPIACKIKIQTKLVHSDPNMTAMEIEGSTKKGHGIMNKRNAYLDGHSHPSGPIETNQIV